MDRVKDINEISDTLCKSKAKLDDYLSKLGWDKQRLLKVSLQLPPPSISLPLFNLTYIT